MSENDLIISLLRASSDKQDDIIARLSELESRVALDAQDAQHARGMVADRMAILEKVIKEEIKPQTDDLKRMKAVGIGFLTVAGIGGLSLGSLFMWGWDNALAMLRHLLKA